MLQTRRYPLHPSQRPWIVVHSDSVSKQGGWVQAWHLLRECRGPVHTTRDSTASKLLLIRKSGCPCDERCARRMETRAWNALQVSAL